MLAAVWRTDCRRVSLESGSGYEALAVLVEMMVFGLGGYLWVEEVSNSRIQNLF